MHELPLVFFTVFAQSAVGLMLVAFISNRLGLASEDVLKKANLLAFALMMAALVIGMFHLGHVFRAFNMLSGVGRSPMSDEIVLSGVFTALLAGTVFFAVVKKVPSVACVLNVLALVAGLVFVWSITRVYQLETVENWNTPYTSLQMWMTVLIGGGACALLAGIRKPGAVVLLAGVALSLLLKPGYFNFINQMSAQMAMGQTWFWGVQLLCLAVGVLVAAYALARKNGWTSVFVAGAVVVMAGELSSRIAFYNLWSISM